MLDNNKILEGHSDLEKGVYLGAIASIATADRVASEVELEYIAELCDAADLSPAQKESVLRAATELSADELIRCLDILKKSDLRYSLLTDLMAFAKSDENYDEAEQQNVAKIADYLGVNGQQFSLLDQFAEKTKIADLPPDENSPNSFLSSLGLKDKLQNVGINGKGLLKGLLGFGGPMLLGSLLSRGLRSRGSVNGGGLLGGGGGLGSVIGMLNGGRGFGSTGGLLGKLLSRRRV